MLLSPKQIELRPCDLSRINLAMVDGKLRPMPFEWWKQFDMNTQMYFMHQNGFYILPTTELIEWLKANIIGSSIEIGAGNGSLGRALNIPRTDSHLQTRPDIALSYIVMGQPPVVYPDDVEKLEAVSAILKYQPQTVIGSYITNKSSIQGEGNYWGIDENWVVNKVKRYIMIGNSHVRAHYSKPILKMPHDRHAPPWLICRAADQSKNTIWIWNNGR